MGKIHMALLLENEHYPLATALTHEKIRKFKPLLYKILNIKYLTVMDGFKKKKIISNHVRLIITCFEQRNLHENQVIIICIFDNLTWAYQILVYQLLWVCQTFGNTRKVFKRNKKSPLSRPTFAQSCDTQTDSGVSNV